jgi:hypothetical protein
MILIPAPALRPPRDIGRFPIFGTLQNRLVKEMRLAGIVTCAEANRFLDGYLPAHNRRFMKAPPWKRGPVVQGLR